jgi:hypothetical protein
MTLQEHYTAIKEGKGNKAQFLKQARQLFPQYFNQYTDFDTATNVLKSKQIINEAAGGVVSKGFDIWDWKNILTEEAKAEEKKVSKEVEDVYKHAYDNKDMKNADNINFNEIMKGFYCELRDEKNNGKTGDELKDIVVKNLAKDPLYYTKNGEFGTKEVGYTDNSPGLSNQTQPKTKEATVLGGHDKVNSESEIVKNSAIESGKKNVQDSLGEKEAKTEDPSKVKEMEVKPQNSKGVKKMPMPGAEKKIKLEESIEEVAYQLPAVGAGGKGDGERKKPKVLSLNKADIDKINNYKPGSIRLLTKDKKTSMYVSDLFKTALDQMERGRSSYEKESKKSELTKLIADVFPPMVRGKIKKELNPKLDPGLKMHYVGINLQPKKDETGYWIMLVGDFDPLVTEQKLRSLIRDIIKEELDK